MPAGRSCARASAARVISAGAEARLALPADAAKCGQMPELPMTDAEMPPGLAETLLDLQEDSQLLVALFDAQDVLRYANKAFRQAYHAEPDGRLNWADTHV
eukprot:Opistho-2@32550